MHRLPLAAGAVAVTGWTAPALAPIFSPVAAALGVPRQIDDDGALALTFDDGPHPEGTPAVLSLLNDAGVTATFFVVGEQVERNRSLTAEIAAAGHTVALHGYRHRNQLRLTPGRVLDDLDRGLAVIADAIGAEPSVHRPPYGIYSHPGLGAARRRGLRPMLWSRWGHDWRRRISPRDIASELTSELTGGDVLLLHDADHYSARDSWRRTVLALGPILEAVGASKLTPRGL